MVISKLVHWIRSVFVCYPCFLCPGWASPLDRVYKTQNLTFSDKSVSFEKSVSFSDDILDGAPKSHNLQHHAGNNSLTNWLWFTSYTTKTNIHPLHNTPVTSQCEAQSHPWTLFQPTQNPRSRQSNPRHFPGCLRKVRPFIYSPAWPPLTTILTHTQIEVWSLGSRLRQRVTTTTILT